MKIVKSIIAVALLFGVIYGYSLETLYFSNTFDSFYLFFRGAAIGAIVGLACFFYYRKTATDGLERFQLGAVFVLLGMFVGPYLAMWSNHFFAKKDPLSINVIFQRDESIRTSRMGVMRGKLPEIEGFYTYFLKNNTTDRVRSKQQLFKGVESGGEVALPIKKGFWGFDFVAIE